MHTLIVALIATVAAWIGLWILAGQADGLALRWTVAGSVFIWIAFGNLYLHGDGGVITAVYLGVLSPMLGCILVAPPWSLFVMFSKPVESVVIGITTSLVVWICSKQLAGEL